jgi:branched-chain amino acid transport system ATP-binding protein
MSTQATAQPALKALGLTKRFGGLAAVNDVSLALHTGRLHAVIGPNGAGKSTLTNLLTGDLPPTAGRVWLNGTDVTGWSNVRLSQAGLGRSFQKTNVLLPFTVWDNVRLAAQSRSGHGPFNPLHWLRRAGTDAAERERTEAAIERAHLSARMHATAATISHGEQRQLEVAMALATQPTVLLLDEPLAGMGAAEAERMVGVLQSLKAQHAMLLVEHDMDAVFALADELTVMVNGQVIATGSPAAVRADTAVQNAYLGEEDTPEGAA